uniref:Uncharacterized protein n=1 Tax=Nelumbo nucifera TaxID=4432 RepID=A0A822YXX1_NELNU|nr:TPA_asm: hypothetical protein HUJ06_007694 [Nelumbo nucifera]
MTNGQSNVKEIHCTWCSSTTIGWTMEHNGITTVILPQRELLNLILRELNAQDVEWIVSSGNGLYQATVAFIVHGHEAIFIGKLRPSLGASIQSTVALGIRHIKEAHRVHVVGLTYIK